MSILLAIQKFLNKILAFYRKQCNIDKQSILNRLFNYKYSFTEPIYSNTINKSSIC